jgi:hypothetical protein
MSDTKDVAAVDFDFLASMAKEVNSPAMIKLPVLKINNQAKSKYKMGAWVVGQKQSEGQIVEEGDEVIQLFILKEYGRYTFFNKKDNNNQCSSPMLISNEKCEGSRYKYQCRTNCPHRNSDLKSEDRCKFNKIFYGYAITKEGKKIECISYLTGTAYKIANDFVKESIFVKTPEGKTTQIPLFSFATLLTSKEEFNKEHQSTYYLPVFTKGKMISSRDILTKFFEKAKEIELQVENMNDTEYADYADYEVVDDNTPVTQPQTVTQEKIEVFQQQTEEISEIQDLDPDDIFKGGFA